MRKALSRAQRNWAVRSGGYTASFSFQWLASPGTPESEALARTGKQDFLDRIGLDPGSLRGRTVLDAGGGRGTLTLLLAGHGGEGVRVDLRDWGERGGRGGRREPGS